MLRTARTASPAPAWKGAIAEARYRPAAARGRSSPGKAIGAFVPGLTRKAFAKFGFSTASLIMDWPRIAGADLARWTIPERVKWPRTFEDQESAGAAGSNTGATLVLRVDPARALDVEYRAKQISERINSYFGYRAIAEIRLLQAPLPAHRQSDPRSRTAAAPAELPDDPLARALARMQAGVAAASEKR